MPRTCQQEFADRHAVSSCGWRAAIGNLVQGVLVHAAAGLKFDGAIPI